MSLKNGPCDIRCSCIEAWFDDIGQLDSTPTNAGLNLNWPEQTPWNKLPLFGWKKKVTMKAKPVQVHIGGFTPNPSPASTVSPVVRDRQEDNRQPWRNTTWRKKPDTGRIAPARNRCPLCRMCSGTTGSPHSLGRMNLSPESKTSVLWTNVENFVFCAGSADNGIVGSSALFGVFFLCELKVAKMKTSRMKVKWTIKIKQNSGRYFYRLQKWDCPRDAKVCPQDHVGKKKKRHSVWQRTKFEKNWIQCVRPSLSFFHLLCSFICYSSSPPVPFPSPLCSSSPNSFPFFHLSPRFPTMCFFSGCNKFWWDTKDQV